MCVCSNYIDLKHIMLMLLICTLMIEFKKPGCNCSRREHLEQLLIMNEVELIEVWPVFLHLYECNAEPHECVERTHHITMLKCSICPRYLITQHKHGFLIPC